MGALAHFALCRTQVKLKLLLVSTFFCALHRARAVDFFYAPPDVHICCANL
jgi:hypothetical protein